MELQHHGIFVPDMEDKNINLGAGIPYSKKNYMA